MPGVASPDPTKFWISLDEQSRAVNFNTGAMVTADRDALLQSVSLAPAVTYSAGANTITTGAFGTFGSRRLAGYAGVKIRVMYDVDTVVREVVYGDADYYLSANHTYVFNINSSGTFTVSATEDGWNWVIQNSSW